MPYAQRDDAGRIIALYAQPGEGAREPVSTFDPAVRAFLAGGETGDPAHAMQRLDLDMARVLEDLIDLLVTRGVITVEDFPAQAQQKLSERSRVRDDLRQLFAGLAEDGPSYDFASLDDGA